MHVCFDLLNGEGMRRPDENGGINQDTALGRHGMDSELLLH